MGRRIYNGDSATSFSSPYFVYFREDGQVWRAGSTNAWETFNGTNYGDYDHALTQIGSTPLWYADVPNHASFHAHRVTAVCFDDFGGGPANGDSFAGGNNDVQTFDYDGGALVVDVTYFARINLNIDDANSQDEWTVSWYRNGENVDKDSGNVQIQLIKRVDGTNLLAATTMTQVASLAHYKYDATTTNRTSAGEAVIAKVTATIDGATRTWYELFSRDN